VGLTYDLVVTHRDTQSEETHDGDDGDDNGPLAGTGIVEYSGPCVVAAGCSSAYAQGETAQADEFTGSFDKNDDGDGDGVTATTCV
jgi:hypothetical protein